MDGNTKPKWYLSSGGKQHGPISDLDLLQFAENGNLRQNDLLWKPGFEDWKTVSSIPGLLSPPRTPGQRRGLGAGAGPHPEVASSPPDRFGPGLEISPEIRSHAELRTVQTQKNPGTTRDHRDKKPSAFKRRFQNGVGTVVKVLAFVVAFSIARAIVGPILHAPEHVTEAQMDQMLQQSNPAKNLYKEIRVDFPADYQLLVSNLTRVMNSSTNVRSDIGAQSSLETARIRKKYAGQLANATDEDLQNYLDAFVGLYKAVLDSEGATKCNQLAKEGPSAINAEKYLNQLMPMGIALLKAISGAMKTPHAARSEATDDDWAALGAKLKLLGAPDFYFDLLQKKDTSNDNYCPALIAFVAGAATLNGEQGERIRVELAIKSAKD
jgi:hypothetical protein